MSDERPNSRWSVIAVVSPLIALGICVLLVFGARANENDWLGLGPIATGLWVIVGGCLISCLAAAISVFKAEERWPIGATAGALSFCFLVYVGLAFVGSERNYERSKKMMAEEDQKQKELFDRIRKFGAAFRETPSLITNDEFWRTNADSHLGAHTALRSVLGDKTFEVTPEIKAYVITNFPGYAESVFIHGRSSHQELAEIAHDQKFPRAVREAAIDCLLRDPTFDVTEEWKKCVLDQFLPKTTFLFGMNRFTKRELEELSVDTKRPDWVRNYAKDSLRGAHYKAEAANDRQ